MNDKNGYVVKASATMKVHYFRLFLRSGIFIIALINYIKNRILRTVDMFGGIFDNKIYFTLVWGYFLYEVMSRFFPSEKESRGSQKMFEINYIPRKKHTDPEKTELASIAGVTVFWIVLNGIIAILYYTSVIDKGMLILISMAYAICDIVCILFFCPFQTWFMKNRCCCTCRIYNWDYMMMFTPLVFMPNIFSLALVIPAAALFMKWEYEVSRHPEFFSEKTNGYLSCASCTEKLCRHKKQLRGFISKGAFDISGNDILSGRSKSPRKNEQ